MKSWKLLNMDCPNCGDELEVLTESEEAGYGLTWIHDGEEVRCMAECGFASSTIVDEGYTSIDDGNLAELLNTSKNF